MKKIIFAAAIAAVMLVSCSKEENKSCYKVSYVMPEQSEVKDSEGEVIKEKIPETQFETYKWATAAEIEACRKNWESMGFKNVLTQEANKVDDKEIKTMADCLSL